MKLLVFVLGQTDKLDTLLAGFAAADICGATVLQSVGMARYLSHEHDDDEIPFLSSLRTFLNPEVVNGNVIFMVIDDEKIPRAIEVIEASIGDLNEKDSGIVFTLPIDFAKGLCKVGK